jgi:hypothetical protein
MEPTRRPSLSGTRTSGNALWWSTLTALCLVLLAPLTLVDVPPLLDYPNHLARVFVLAFVHTDPVLARFYVPRWAIIPNLGLDLTVPPLLWIFPVHLVGRAVIAVMLLLPVFGAVSYHYALNRRLSYWPLASVLVAYNGASLRGFLNFIISVGLALLLGAAWVLWRDRRPSLAIPIAAAGAVALFFCHLTGLLFFAILIGGNELASLLTTPFKPATTLRRAAIVVAVFVAPLTLYAVSDLQGMDGDSAFRAIASKAGAALTPVINYAWPLDLLTAALCLVVPLLCLVARWCEIQFQAAAAIVVMLLLFLGLPVAFKGTNDLDMRFIIMAAFTIFAALTPTAPPHRAVWVIGTGFLLLFGARMIVLMTAWHVWAGELTMFRSAIASIRPGDAVMTIRSPPSMTVLPTRILSDGTATDPHLPALLLIDHRAWWPYLFDNVSQQPVKTLQPYRAAANMIDNSENPIALLVQGAPDLQPITHVLVIGPDPSALGTVGLTLVTANSVAALFTVDRNEIRRLNSPPPVR